MFWMRQERRSRCSWRLLAGTVVVCVVALLAGLEFVLRFYQVDDIHVHQLPRAALKFMRYGQACYLPNQEFRLKELSRNARNFAEVADEVGLRYWLDFGSLLGAYRNGRIIPWDHDVDLGAMREDFLAKLSIMKDKLKQRGDLIYYQSACRFFIRRDGIPAAARGEIIRMEVVLHVPVNTSPENGPDGPLITRCEVLDTFRYTFPRRYIDRPEKLGFEGMPMWAPRPHEEFLIRYRFPRTYWFAMPFRISCYFESLHFFGLLLLAIACVVAVPVVLCCGAAQLLQCVKTRHLESRAHN